MDDIRRMNRIMQQLTLRFGGKAIREVKAAEGCCTLRLRDGGLFLARLDRRGELVLEELEGDC